MGELKHQVKRNFNSFRKTFGLKDSSKKHRRMTPLDDEQIADVEGDLGQPLLDEKTRKKRRNFARVADSILGPSDRTLGE